MVIYDGKLTDGNLLHVEAVSERTFRVRIYDRWDKESGMNRYGLILSQSDPHVNVCEENHVLTATTKCAALSVSTLDGSLSLSDAAGHVLTSNVSAPVNEHEGWCSAFGLKEGTRVYGMGDVTRERVEKTGFASEMWVENVERYIPIPFIQTTAGWGLYVNTTWRHNIDVGKTVQGELRLYGQKGGIDVYLFVGADCETLLNEYTNLLGKPAMLPAWAYGLVYVCNQKVNDYEMMQECLNFRREGIPCDVCGLEPGWMSKNYDFSTEKSWDLKKFYIPFWAPKGDATFFGALKRLGFKLSLWLCCDYDLSYEEERQAKGAAAVTQRKARSEDDFEQDENFGGSSLMDKITKPDEPWFEHLKKFVDQGACCFKLDGANQVNEHPDRKWGNGMDDEEMHNLYPVIYNKQMSNGFVDYTGRRSMVYSSGGWAGIQRFGATWAGDTGGGPKPLVHMLNHGYSGHVNASCDMDIYTPGGIHFGFFQPWSQLCNWAYWRQPWFLPKDREDMYRFYAHLRYRMLPYIYAMAHRASQTGYPMMRAMSMVFPDMPDADKLIYQYMFGDDMLTAAFAEEITLPDGRWTDAWTGTVLEGGRSIKAEYPETVGGPLYIRENAIIPTCEPGEYIGQKPITHIELNLYPACGERTYELYEDDGISMEYRSGRFAVTHVTTSVDADGVLTVRISPRTGEYDGKPARDYSVNIMNRSVARRVLVNGKPAEYAIRHDGWCAQVDEGFISIPVAEGDGDLTITIE